MSALKKAILRTLAYADVFDYPLTIPEVWRFLITRRKVRVETIQKELERMSTDLELISTEGKFYFLRGREDLVAVRKRREKWSEEKLKIALRVAGWLRLIPWVKMVAVTGALAMENSDRNDDIDLFFITAKNRLWLSRGLMVTALRLLDLYRRPDKIKNRICPNMFLDESYLCLPQEEQSLFTAHEVCQLKPLWERDGVYEKLIEENKWVKKYLPNALENTSDGGRLERSGSHDSSEVKRRERFPNCSITQLFNCLEFLAYRIQLAYMKSRKTTEITELHRVRFHPQDCREWVLKEYQNNCEIVSLKNPKP